MICKKANIPDLSELFRTFLNWKASISIDYIKNKSKTLF